MTSEVRRSRDKSLCYFSPVSHYTRNAVFKDLRTKIFQWIDFFLIFYSSQIMSYLCQKCKNKMGVSDFVSEIKRVENDLIFKNWRA